MANWFCSLQELAGGGGRVRKALSRLVGATRGKSALSALMIRKCVEEGEEDKLRHPVAGIERAALYAADRQEVRCLYLTRPLQHQTFLLADDLGGGMLKGV